MSSWFNIQLQGPGGWKLHDLMLIQWELIWVVRLKIWFGRAHHYFSNWNGSVRQICRTTFLKPELRTVLNMNKNQFRTVHIVSDPEQLFALDSAWV